MPDERTSEQPSEAKDVPEIQQHDYTIMTEAELVASLLSNIKRVAAGEIIDTTDKRFAQRDDQGQFKESENVLRWAELMEQATQERMRVAELAKRLYGPEARTVGGILAGTPLAERLQQHWSPHQSRNVLDAQGRVVGGDPPVGEDEQLARLSARIHQVIAESKLAAERIAKDQEQIKALAMETRAMLESLRA